MFGRKKEEKEEKNKSNKAADKKISKKTSKKDTTGSRWTAVIFILIMAMMGGVLYLFN